MFNSFLTWHRSMPRLVLSMLIMAAVSAQSDAQDAAPVTWPDAKYQQDIPTMSDVLGYSPGARISWSHSARAYFDALQLARPDQVLVEGFGRSWEGRELFYVALGSAENIARIDGIKAGMQTLLDPKTTSQEVDALIASMPAVTWLAYGVHGNEISSTDAAMMTAYHLLAAEDDVTVRAIIDNTVVVLVPIQNPDGRDRFVHFYESTLGLEASSDRLSAEHNEPWPGGRTNHYLFDLNRDWFIRTQPEVSSHGDLLRQWLPVAFVDLHEMGSDATYYFAPEAVPYNPHLAGDQRASLERFGRNNAKIFDQFGIDYFTREVYDAFYPGYGASWPSYFGSVAMTYEQASARGLVVRQYDGVEVPYEATVRNHFLTSITTAATVARDREQLLREFREYQLSAIDEGRSEAVKAFVIPRQRDQDAVQRVATLLQAQGVRIEEAQEEFKACNQRLPSGSLIINLDQPAKRLVRTLLDQEVSMDPEFVAEQERRRAKNLSDEFYDVTAWSMPLLFNVEVLECDRKISVASVPFVRPIFAKSLAVASVAYLVPWGERDAVQLLAKALRDNLAVKSSDRAFTWSGIDYPAGTLIIDVADNPADLNQRLVSYIAETGADVVAVNDSWVTAGPNFGSGHIVRMNTPRIAMLWDTPTSSYSAGNFRFVVERQFGFPVTAIRAQQLASADLSRYQVLVLPDLRSGAFIEMMGAQALTNLSQWVERGGVLVALGEATRVLTDEGMGILAAQREYSLPVTDDDEAGESSKDSNDKHSGRVAGKALDADGYAAAIAAQEVDPPSIGGAFLRSTVDPDHWLAAGVAQELPLLARRAEIYTPLALDEGVNVVVFSDAESVLMSGHSWDTIRRQVAFKPAVMARRLGRGQIVAFTQDPTVRAYQDGLNVLVANALFRGAAHARPVR